MKGGGKIPYLGLFKWQQIRSHEACNTIYYIFFTHKDIIFSIQIDISTFPEIIITDHVPWTTFFCHQRVVLMLLRYEEQGKVILNLRKQTGSILNAYQYYLVDLKAVHTPTYRGSQGIQL